MRAKSGYFTIRSDNGSQSITGLGFQPTCVLILSPGPMALGYLGGWPAIGYGMACLTTKSPPNDIGQFCSTINYNYDGAGASTYGISDGTILLLPGNAIIGSLTSFDADGFTLSIANGTAVQPAFTYLAMNPAITDYSYETLLGTSGSSSVTNIGFTPVGAVNIGGATTGSTVGVGIGGGSSKSTTASSGVRENTASSFTMYSKIESWDRASDDNTFYFGGIGQQMGLSAFTATGYNYTRNRSIAYPTYFGTFCFGGDFKIVAGYAACTQEDDQKISLPFKPAGVVFFGNAPTIETAPNYGSAGLANLYSSGVADDELQHSTYVFSDTEVGIPGTQHTYLSATEFYPACNWITGAGPYTPSGGISVVSMDDDGLVIDSTAMGLGDPIIYMIFGPGDDNLSSLCAMGVG